VATATTPKWQACSGTTTKRCTAILDPTASTLVDFPIMIHNMHSGRLRAGYLERNDLDSPGVFNVSGNQFGDALLPMDLRSCTKCHADTLAVCSTDTDCGYGQSCTGGKCTNSSWMAPSMKACITCHDTAGAYAHAQLNTYTDSSGVKIEACSTCHGPKSDWAVAKVHDLSGVVPALGGEHFLKLEGAPTPVSVPWFRSKEARSVWESLVGFVELDQ
jgi:hypothetical protein